MCVILVLNKQLKMSKSIITDLQNDILKNVINYLPISDIVNLTKAYNKRVHEKKMNVVRKHIESAEYITHLVDWNKMNDICNQFMQKSLVYIANINRVYCVERVKTIRFDTYNGILYTAPFPIYANLTCHIVDIKIPHMDGVTSNLSFSRADGMMKFYFSKFDLLVLDRNITDSKIKHIFIRFPFNPSEEVIALATLIIKNLLVRSTKKYDGWTIKIAYMFTAENNDNTNNYLRPMRLYSKRSVLGMKQLLFKAMIENMMFHDMLEKIVGKVSNLNLKISVETWKNSMTIFRKEVCLIRHGESLARSVAEHVEKYINSMGVIYDNKRSVYMRLPVQGNLQEDNVPNNNN